MTLPFGQTIDWSTSLYLRCVNQTSVDLLSDDSMPFYQMSVDQMSFDQMSFDRVSVNQMSVNQMSVNLKSVDKISSHILKVSPIFIFKFNIFSTNLNIAHLWQHYVVIVIHRCIIRDVPFKKCLIAMFQAEI